MVGQTGGSGESLAAARLVLGARDADLAAADAVLAGTVEAAYRIAVESIRRLEAIGTGIDALAAVQPAGSHAAAHEVSRQLIARQREIAAVVSEVRNAAHAKAVALQQLRDRYRPQ